MTNRMILDGLEQDSGNSIANALELGQPQSCPKSSIWLTKWKQRVSNLIILKQAVSYLYLLSNVRVPVRV